MMGWNVSPIYACMAVEFHQRALHFMYACIDLGSNSFHLLIADQSQESGTVIIERFSRKVQLGEGVATTGCINGEAFQRGLTCLREFREALSQYPVERIWTAGTNALRVAGNAEEFVRAAAEIGFDIQVITGEEEAALVYSGVSVSFPPPSACRAVLDIGGGSTELIVGKGSGILFLQSMSMGCVSWRDRYFADSDQLDDRRLQDRVIEATEAAAAHFDWTQGMEGVQTPMEVFASSGTAKMLAAVCTRAGGQRDEISLPLMQALEPEMRRTARTPGLLLPGVKAARRDLLLPGYCIMRAFMQSLDIKRLCFSRTAMREGMLALMPGAAGLEQSEQINLKPELRGLTGG